MCAIASLAPSPFAASHPPPFHRPLPQFQPMFAPTHSSIINWNPGCTTKRKGRPVRNKQRGGVFKRAPSSSWHKPRCPLPSFTQTARALPSVLPFWSGEPALANRQRKPAPLINPFPRVLCAHSHLHQHPTATALLPNPALSPAGIRRLSSVIGKVLCWFQTRRSSRFLYSPV